MPLIPRAPAVALAALVLASPLAAQATGLVVRGAGVVQGFTVGVGYSRGRSDRSPTTGPTGSDAVGVRASLGFGPVGVAAGLTRNWLQQAIGATQTANEVSATATLTVFGGPLVPLSIAWQVGGSRRLDGPSGGPWRGTAGIGASLTIPAAILSIKPWLAPRLEYRGGPPVAGHRLNTAFAAGVDLGLLNGLGIQVEFDSRLGWDDGRGAVRGIGFGLSHHF